MRTLARLRSGLVVVHRWMGLAMAGFLVIAGLTGSIIVFQAEVDAWLNPALFRVSGAEKPIALDLLVSRVETALPEMHVASIDLTSDRRRAIQMFVSPRIPDAPVAFDQVFVDPASGRILGKRQWGAVGFDRLHFATMVYRLHYTLLLPNNIGKTLMGCVALAWMVDCIVGFYLTLPRGKPFWRKWSPSWQVKRGAGNYRRLLDLHRAPGLWLWPVLFVMAFSGMALSLETQIFRPLVIALLPTTPELHRLSSSISPGRRIGFSDALALAERAARERGFAPATWTRITQGEQAYRVRFERRTDTGLNSSEVVVGAASGSIVSAHAAGAGRTGDVLTDLRLPVHSGRVGGLWTRLLVSATGLIVATLSVTGFLVWWRKRRGRTHRDQRHSPSSMVGAHAAE